ncbi:MAG: hypothetical protein BIFFINMI_00360 [Phycisphaerae bacterium]|nr:hypothetical protein [Phycisphaerae bacterium]
MAPGDYSNYAPLLLGDGLTVDRLRRDDYRAFIHSASIEPGVRLLVARRRARPDWPLIDTKFNPNTGEERGEAAYGVVYGWFLGRGIEALAGHLPVLDRLAGLKPDERRRAREDFGEMSANTVEAIAAAREVNGGRIPFRMNRDFAAIGPHGEMLKLALALRSDTDLFCGKGLIAAGGQVNVSRGLTLLLECAKELEANRFVSEPSAEPDGRIEQGSRMLMHGAAGTLFGVTKDAALRRRMLGICAAFLNFTLDHHYDSASADFSEWFDASTGDRGPHLDPGHANELAGLGLGAVACMEAFDVAGYAATIERGRRELPRLLARSTALGWNARYEGLHKAVDPFTGRVINEDMPWWNLPETMRAIVRALAVCGDEAVRATLLGQFARCHNAYFAHYLNRGLMLFPFQTRSGGTGRVVDRVPAVPEGDPLYHSNLSFLEMLEEIDLL